MHKSLGNKKIGKDRSDFAGDLSRETIEGFLGHLTEVGSKDPIPSSIHQVLAGLVEQIGKASGDFCLIKREAEYTLTVKVRDFSHLAGRISAILESRQKKRLFSDPDWLVEASQRLRAQEAQGIAPGEPIDRSVQWHIGGHQMNQILLVYLCHKCGDHEEKFLDVKEVSRDLGIVVSDVERTLRDLVRIGLLDQKKGVDVGCSLEVRPTSLGYDIIKDGRLITFDVPKKKQVRKILNENKLQRDMLLGLLSFDSDWVSVNDLLKQLAQREGRKRYSRVKREQTIPRQAGRLFSMRMVDRRYAEDGTLELRLTGAVTKTIRELTEVP